MLSIATESDATLINLLRKQEAASISELVEALGVTATAVRQRLGRLMEDGFVRREEVVREGRGRPSHRYMLTDKGLRSAGDNYAELAEVLWAEIRSIEDSEIRTGLLKRIAMQLAARSGALDGDSLEEKMQALVVMMGERQVPFEVDSSGPLPVLTAVACPYPDLVEQDRSICAMEKILFSEVLGQPVHLTECRPNGAACCSFEASSAK